MAEGNRKNLRRGAVYRSLLIKQNHNFVFSIYILQIQEKSLPKNVFFKLILQPTNRAFLCSASPNCSFAASEAVNFPTSETLFKPHVLDWLLWQSLKTRNNAVLCQHLLTVTKLFTRLTQKELFSKKQSSFRLAQKQNHKHQHEGHFHCQVSWILIFFCIRKGRVGRTGKLGLTYIHYHVYNRELVGTCYKAQEARLGALWWPRWGGGGWRGGGWEGGPRGRGYRYAYSWFTSLYSGN